MAARDAAAIAGDGRVALALGSAATFVAGDCSREGRLALWGGRQANHDSTTTVVAATPSSVRRVEVACSWLAVGEAVDVLLDADAGSLSDSARAWRAVLLHALELISRGRLTPATTGASTPGVSDPSIPPTSRPERSWPRRCPSPPSPHPPRRPWRQGRGAACSSPTHTRPCDVDEGVRSEDDAS
jgi:hypothetical protein